MIINFHLSELQLDLLVATSNSGFTFDLTKRTFKDLALRHATPSGDVNIFENMLDFKNF